MDVLFLSQSKLIFYNFILPLLIPLTHALTKAFKTRQGVVQAVRGVDLAVQEGEIFGFLGPNGAAKTRTMRMLATLLAPTSGQAKVATYDLRREAAKVRRHIGVA